MEAIREAATLIILRDGARGLEALVGQNEIVNFLRSTPEQTVFMRFPGEYKFSGGMVEETDATKQAAAKREVEEEFLGLTLPLDVYVALFNVKHVEGKKPTNMNNYVLILDSDAQAKIDVNEINARLEERRRRYVRTLEGGTYYLLGQTEKEKLSPEVHEVRWLPVEEVIRIGEQDEYVNTWQQQEFERYGLTAAQRERTVKTIETLKEIQRYQTVQALMTCLGQK